MPSGGPASGDPFRPALEPKFITGVPAEDQWWFQRDDQRVRLLRQWRTEHSYLRQTKEEAAAEERLAQKDSLASLATYAAVGASFWITGHPSTAEMYDRVGVSGALRARLLELQRYKLRWTIGARMLAAAASSVPCALYIGAAEGEYFETIAKSKTPYGHFARHLVEQGKRLSEGQPQQAYVAQERVRRRYLGQQMPSVSGAQHLAQMDEQRRAAAQPHSKEALRVEPEAASSDQVFSESDAPGPREPQGRAAQRAAAAEQKQGCPELERRRLQGAEAADPLDQFLDHVFGPTPPLQQQQQQQQQLRRGPVAAAA
eukprot:TRINITY_DN6035_c2_g6_i1.p1 TRINITY_DN6035_c2_g6~~TRINITY_DN6035_c2_g6_i1.p1  ORF type:complete len:341 (+),score=125.60 TRINITY_DN6035_c2_g6_i1:81-1025(+)